MRQSSADAAAIQRGVAMFLERILADPGLMRYWSGMDEARLRRHARDLILHALGGPPRFEGDMHAAHEALGIDDADFDRVAGELMATLRDVGVSDDIVELGGRRIDELRPVIVTVRRG